MDSDQMAPKHLTICDSESDLTYLMTSSMLSRTSSSSSSAIGDYIGTESCFDVLSEENYGAVIAEPDRNIEPPCLIREAKSAAAREFPPPIPRLARTENLPSHMPWVLTRVYTSDGRLILREEKVRHHEYFRAYRSNGRLTLQLVPLDDDEDDVVMDAHHHDHKEVAHDDEHDDEVLSEGEFLEEDDIDKDDSNILEDAHDENGDDVHHDDVKCNVYDGGDDRGIGLPSVADQIGGGSPGGKCLKSCFPRMQFPEIRHVLS